MNNKSEKNENTSKQSQLKLSSGVKKLDKSHGARPKC